MARVFMLMVALAAGPAAAGDPPAREIVVRPGEPIAATVSDTPARLLVGSGRIDRLMLDADFVAAHAIRPAFLTGTAELQVAGRREIRGHNRPVTLRVAGRVQKARAEWFPGVPDRGADGSVGPFGLPQDRVTFVLGPVASDTVQMDATLGGNIDSSGYFAFPVGEEGRGGGAIGVSFDVDDAGRYPVASAAAGALIARTFGGQLSGPSWDVEIVLGVRRPVRLLTLARPLVIGMLSFGRLAVRVPDRIDASGRGQAIADADAPLDPSEIVVEASGKGPKAIYSLTIPLGALGGCSRLSIDKAARRIELACRPTRPA